MKILLSNDDGVYAPGLKQLYNSLKTVADVFVVAPDRDRSAASKSLTVDVPIRAVELENGFVAVSGTPTDCVHLALTMLMPEKPDLVVAGINAGANLGDDVWYSGTVAAATEAQFLGVPGLAFSLVGRNNYATAGEIAKLLVAQTATLPLDNVLNINIPDIPMADIKGIKVSRLGKRHRVSYMVADTDPRGRKIYWVGSPGAAQDAGIGTDFDSINNNYVSVTPLQMDLTDHTALEKLNEHVYSII